MTDNTDDRQAAVDEAADRGIEQFDFSAGMEFDLTPDAIQGVVNDLGAAEGAAVEGMDSVQLADYVEVLKSLENAAEEARKEVFEPELEDRVEVGESIGNLRRQTGKNTWVEDTEGAFAAVAEAGEDPLDVAKVSISGLRDVLGDAAAEEFMGEAEYDYFKRQA